MDINRYSPRYGVNYKHMTKLADFSTEEIFEFLYATRAMKDKFIAHEDTRILNGVTVALLFGALFLHLLFKIVPSFKFLFLGF